MNAPPAVDPRPLSILLIDDEPLRTRMIANAIQEAGDYVSGCYGPESALTELVAQHDPDVIIIDMDAPSRATLEQITEISRTAPRPIVMFTHDRTHDHIHAAIRAGVSAYVVDGLPDKRVKSVVEVAIARFQEFREMQGALARAQESLETRKPIEQAKGILMSRRQCSEKEAHRMLQQLAMNRRKKIHEVAQDILSLAELLDSASE